MAKKSKLLTALDAYKGRDYEAEKRQKQVKAAEKRKRQKSETAKEDAEPEQDGGNDVSVDQNGDASLLDQGEKEEFASFSNDEEDEPNGTSTSTTIPQPHVPVDASASEAENESDVPLSDLEDEDLEDTIPHQRLTINNGPALLASCKRISLIKNHKSMPFHAHNSLISSLPTTETSIPDPNDDLTRELEFYRIARDAAVEARALLKKEKVPFSRPADYFAEMVKSDEHMGRVKKKMYDDAASKKAGEEARKLRDAKKFGKAVQVAKEQERAKEKRNTLDKIKEMKRSKQYAHPSPPN
jgi:rRNA-processing protein EBP2